MGIAVCVLKSEDGWIDICQGSPSYSELTLKIKKYFNITEELANFRRRKTEGCLEITCKDGSKGFVISDTSESDDYEKKMQAIKDNYKDKGMSVVGPVVDYEDEFAGFLWRIE